MSLNVNFQLNKVSRFIKLHGSDFQFVRYDKNAYNEPDKNKVTTIQVRGVYHEVNSQVTFSSSDATTIRTKPQPRILCMPEEGAKVKTGDELTYKGTRYKVVEPVDLAKQGICVDVSLEVIQDG